jgi:hypothetical protein
VITANRNVGGLLSLVAVLAFVGCGGGYDSSSTEVNTATAAAQRTTVKAAEKTAAAEPAEVEPAEVTPTEPVAQLAATPPPTSRKVDTPLPTSRKVASRPPKDKDPARRTVPGSQQQQPAAEPSPATLTVDPAELDMGTIATGKSATGTVRLTNSGPDPITIQDCRTSCGCTTTSCPKGKALQPGESADVEIRLSGGSRARRVKKTVTFRVVDQQPVTMPVSVQVVAYVTIEPMTIDPEEAIDGRVLIKATDEQPFRIVSMTPQIIEVFPTEPSLAHEVFLDWDVWRELGRGRRMVFKIDHPKTDSVTTIVRVKPKRSPRPTNRQVPDRRPDDRTDRQKTRDSLRESGIADRPLETPDPPAKAAIAVKGGNVDSLRKQLSLGVSEDQRNELLGLAARHGQVEIMGLLMEAGATPTARDSRGRTPLMAAVQSRNAEAIRYLIDNGAEVNARDQLEGTALLRAAGAFGNLESVQVLLSAGADVNVQDKSGMTPLMWAARWGDTGRVKALLTAGADVTARDNGGKTALDWARQQGEKAGETIKVLQPLSGK